MPIIYNKLFNLLDEKGWTTYRIRKEKLIGQATLTALKNGKGGIDSKTISRLCEVLECQPGDLMEYIPEEQKNNSEIPSETKLSDANIDKVIPIRNLKIEDTEPKKEPNKQYKELTDADLSEIDFHRLVNDPVYQIDMASIYGMNVLAELLEKARERSASETEK